MQRLPQPGGDHGNWGQILNEYLSVEHNNDGTLKKASTIDSAVQTVNGKTGTSITLTASDVSAIATTAAGAASGVATLDTNSKLTTSQLPSGLARADHVIQLSEYTTNPDYSNVYDAFQQAINDAQNNSKDLILDVKGTMDIAKANAGGLKIAPGKALRVIGPGKENLTLKLSASVPRLFDLDPLQQQDQTFRDIYIGGFTCDANNIDGTAKAPATTITANATIAGGYAWTRISLTNNANFQETTNTVWFLPSNTGTAQSVVMGYRPVAGSSTDIEVQSANAVTVVSGDQITGALPSEHCLIGNRHSNKLQIAADGVTKLRTNFNNIVIEDIDVINLPATQADGGLGAPTPSLRFGVGIYPTAAPSTVSNITYRRLRIFGGDCGTWTVGAAGTFIDNIVHESCFHDRGSVATANYSSLNFMVAGDAWCNRVYFRGCYGKNSGDVGIEVDQPMFLDIDAQTLIEDAYSANYYITTFSPPARSINGPPTTTLSASITNSSSSATTATLPAGIDGAGYCQIDSEIIPYERSSATSLNLPIRGFNGSTAASHASGATVTFIEVHKQKITILGRSRRLNANSGRGLAMYKNHNLPFPPIALGGSHERLNDNGIPGECVYISGHTPAFDLLDGYKATMAGSTGDSAVSGFIFDQPGTAYNGVLLTFPTRVRIGDVSLRGSGVVSSGGSMSYVYFQRGYYEVSTSDLKIYNAIRGISGKTNAIKFDGQVASSEVCRFRAKISMGVWNSASSDGAFTGVAMEGYVSMEKADLDLDLLSMNYSSAAGHSNYRPWTAAAADSSKIIIRGVRHSNQVGFSTTSGFPTRPKKWFAINATTTATHDNEIISVDTSTASGTVTITLPSVVGGNSSTNPKPGDGAELQVLDVGNNASVRNIVITAPATDKLNGTTSGTHTINSNGGKARLVGHSTHGWWVV